MNNLLSSIPEIAILPRLGRNLRPGCSWKDSKRALIEYNLRFYRKPSGRFVVLMVFASCSPFSRVETACVDGSSSVIPYGINGFVYDEIQAECTKQILKVIDIDVDSFGNNIQIKDFSIPKNQFETVIAGIYSIVASDQEKEIASTLAIYDYPELIENRVNKDKNTSEKEFFFSFFDEATYEISLFNDKNIKIDAIMSSGTWFKIVQSMPIDYPPYLAAATLLHESTHTYYHHDIYCDSGEFEYVDDVDKNNCDTNVEGAYGVEASWLYSWIDNNKGSIFKEDCVRAASMVETSCNRILFKEDFAPCEPELLDYICE